MVFRRWAIMSIVHVLNSSLMVLWISASVLTSTAAVASSRTRIFDLRSIARARLKSCLCPTLKFSPPSETLIKPKTTLWPKQHLWTLFPWNVSKSFGMLLREKVLFSKNVVFLPNLTSYPNIFFYRNMCKTYIIHFFFITVIWFAENYIKLYQKHKQQFLNPNQVVVD